MPNYGSTGFCPWIYDHGIASTLVQTGAISKIKIAPLAVSTTKIVTGTITAPKLGSSSVITAKLGVGVVTTSKIANSAVTAGKIAANAITSAKINANAVTNAKILAGAVGSAQLAANAVTSAKILAGAVGPSALAANAVTNAKIADGIIGIGTGSFAAFAGKLNAKYVKVSAAVTGVVVTVAHGLGRAPIGYVMARTKTRGRVYDASAAVVFTVTNMYLKVSVTGINNTAYKLMVF